MNRACKLVALHGLKHHVIISLEFVQAPSNKTCALLGDEDVIFVCHIHGQTLFWRIDDTLYNYVSISMFRNKGILVETDTMAPGGQVYERLRVRVSRQNNDTKVVCQGTVPNEVSNFSEPAFLYIAGKCNKM